MDLIQALQKTGFTEYEAKVYLALLRDNPATGYHISKVSGVPRSMVYETLSRLHGRGVVLETMEGRATLYRPLPPLTLLDHHEQERDQLIQTLKDGLSAVYNAPEQERVWTISGQRAVFAYASRLLKEAQSEVYQVLTDRALIELETELTHAVARGVQCHTLLTGEATLSHGIVARHPPMESELQELTATLLLVVDQHEVLIASMDPETMATTTTNRNLVLVARQFVWMELFSQRIYATLGSDLLDRLEPEDRLIFAGHEPSEKPTP